MKFKRFSKLIFLFLALMFCLAVSGGCGGGSSGRYSSNYAVSSQDVTPEPESQDVTPTPLPENPTSGDEVGYNGWEDVSYLDTLNNTEWVIESVKVMEKDYTELEIEPNSYNYNVSRIKLLTAEDELMWVDADGSYHFDALTILFYNDWLANSSSLAIAPILRTVVGLKEQPSFNLNYNYLYQASLGNEGSEKIEFGRLLDRIVITNVFYVDISGVSTKRISELVLRKY